METRRILVAAASILATATASADVAMSLSADKLHYQTTPMTLRFETGSLDIVVRDGAVILDPACVIDPQLFFFPPSNIPPCPLGATGFVASGDVDRDGVRDDNQYWSVSNVIPALVIEPARPELCQLYSAPPSKLPRPLSDFDDDSVVTFFDISTPFVQQFDLSRYLFSRFYGSVRQVETVIALGDVAPLGGGTVNAVVTGVDIIGSPLAIPFNVENAQTGAEWAESLRTQLAGNAAVDNFYAVGGSGNVVTLTERVPNGNDSSFNVALIPGTANVTGLPSLNSFDTQQGAFNQPAAALKQMNDEIIPGQYVFTFPRLADPDKPVAIPVSIVPIVEAVNPAGRTRAGFRFTTGTWRGDIYQMDPRTITRVRWVGNDRTVVRPGDQIFFSVMNEAEDFLLFPPTVPQNPVFLPTPTTQQYTIPPFFFDVGQAGVMELLYQRTLFTTGVSADTSTRQFRAKVEMVDSFAGYAQITLPAGSPKRDYLPSANFDRDSMTNLEEFAYQFPTNEDINARAREQFVPLAADIPPALQGFGFVSQFNKVVSKLPNPIIDSGVQPVGPAPAFIDGGKAVFEAPFRPRTGNTLRYSFGIKDPAKKKPVKIRVGVDYIQSFREVNSVVAATIQVKIVDPADGSTIALVTRPAQTNVNLTQQFIRITSVANVAAAPDIRVTLSAVTLK